MEKAKHVGVYALVVQDGEVLMIKKNRGPYTGLLDLPGGSMEHGESVEETLAREVQEEVGVTIQNAEQLCNMTYLAEWVDQGIPKATHHIGMYYMVWIDSTLIRTGADGHDSDGALWVSIQDVQESQVAPIVWKVFKKIGMK